MPGPTEEQIEKWRARWKRHPGLSDKIADLLMEHKEEMSKSDEKIIEVYETIRGWLSGKDFYVPDGSIIRTKGVEVLYLDLRGINWNGKQLDHIVLPSVRLDGAYLHNVVLNGAILGLAHFNYAELPGAKLDTAKLGYACMIGAKLLYVGLEKANLEHSILINANFFQARLDDAYLENARLENARLIDAKLRNANLEKAVLDGAKLLGATMTGANLSNASFIGADFTGAHVGSIKRISQNTEESTDEKLELEQTDTVTRFSNSIYLPLLPELCDRYIEKHYPQKKKTLLLRTWVSIPVFIQRVFSIRYWESIFNYWFFTDFRGVNIDDADTSDDREFARYVRDQQFIGEIKERHPLFYRIWAITSNCGKSPWLIAFWAFLIVAGFAHFYQTLPWQPASWLPEWWSNFFAMNGPALNVQSILHESALSTDESLKGLKYFYISFDIFSNLGLRTTEPQNFWGMVLMITESVLGFATFASLASYLANRFFRRAG